MIERVKQILFDMADFLFGEQSPGAETTRSHDWPWPPSVTVLVMAGAAALVIWVYVRERGSAGRFMKTVMVALRLLLIALVLFMLYGWVLNRHRTDLPDLLVVLDDSASMATEDHYDDPSQVQQLEQRVQAAGLAGTSRINLAKMLLLSDDARLLDELQRKYRLKIYRVSTSARAVTAEAVDEGIAGAASISGKIAELQATEPASRLGKGVQDVLGMQGGRPTAALVMFTDGVTTEGRAITEVASYARRKSVPLFLVGLGNPDPPRDVRLSDLLVDDVVFVDDLVSFDFKVTASGFEGNRVTVRLRQKGDSGPPLDEIRITLGADGHSQSVRLATRPEQEGEFEYVVQVEDQKGEANVDNNLETRVIRVRDETLRVLFVQAYPNYEFRFLKSLLGRVLKRDSQEKSVQLTTVLQEADLEYSEQDETATRGFPVDREELFGYDVLIFGDVNPAFLSRSVMDNIRAFVQERGGGVVFLAGPRYTPIGYRDTPLESLFPVDLDTAAGPPVGLLLTSGFSVQPTRLGSATPHLQLGDRLAESLQIWRDLPPLYWLFEARDLKPGAMSLVDVPSRTLTDGRSLPLVCLQFVGAGKVLFHTTDETYRWSRDPSGGQHYARYWIQTLRYLSRSRLLEGSRLAELKSDRAEYRRGDPVRLRVRFFDDRLAPAHDQGVTVVLEQEGNKRRQITLKRDAASRGVFEGVVANLPEGRYRAWLATPALDGQPPSQRFSVLAPPGEQRRLEMDAADLRRAAKATEGKFYTLETADRLLEELPAGRQVRIQSLPPEPIWNSPLLAALFVAAIVGEWLLRKRYGLM